MNTQGIVCMSNSIGRLLQGLAVGSAEAVIDDILDRSPETALYIPDEGIDCTGWEACRRALLDLNRRSYGYLHLTHTGAYKQCDDGSVMGHWNTYTYQMYTDETGSHIRYSYWRITARFLCVDGQWKMRTLSELKLLHVDPWDYDPADEPGLLDAPGAVISAPEGCASPQDYVELRNLAGHMTQDGIFNCRDLFALDADLCLYLPDVMDAPASGRAAVMEAIDRLERLEAANLNLYPSFTAVCTPVITASGDAAHASYLAFVVNFRGPAFGYPKAPYRCQYRLAAVYIDYIRENGVWKVTSYRSELLSKLNDMPFMNIHHDGSDGYPNRVEYMSRIPNRNLSPRWEGCPASAEDIFEIESILPEWTERLKRRDLPDFPDLFMTNRQHDLVIQLSRGYFGSKAVHEHAYRVINGMLEGHETMWHNPQFHTGCAPVIELSHDGLSAQAWFVDKCWGNIGAAVFYDADVIDRQYFPGMGTYCHKLVKEDGRWRLWRFGWSPTFGWSDGDPYRYTYNYRYKETGGWSEWAAKGGDRQWPLPFEDFRY